MKIHELQEGRTELFLLLLNLKQQKDVTSHFLSIILSSGAALYKGL
jgi:hypothetical protein